MDAKLLTMKLADHFYVALDCENTVELAQFYAQITGLRIETFGASLNQSVEWIELRDEQDIPKLAFQRIKLCCSNLAYRKCPSTSSS